MFLIPLLEIQIRFAQLNSKSTQSSKKQKWLSKEEGSGEPALSIWLEVASASRSWSWIWAMFDPINEQLEPTCNFTILLLTLKPIWWWPFLRDYSVVVFSITRNIVNIRSLPQTIYKCSNKISSNRSFSSRSHCCCHKICRLCRETQFRLLQL